jgi:OmpA-OmpF porin, OOP family
MVFAARRAALTGAALLSLAGASSRAADAPESHDHPLVHRYPGSEAEGQEGQSRDYDEAQIVLGKAQGDGQAEKSLKVAGRVYSVVYRNPEGRSVLEVYKNYEQVLLKEGFQPAWSCNGAECGSSASFDGGRLRFYDPGYLRRFFVGRLARPQGDVYAEVMVEAQEPQLAGETYIEVVEVKPMQGGMIAAGTLADDIAHTGHAAVYGIYFDSGKSVVKPDSDPTLKEIGKLMAAQPKLSLYVVGHTDALGALESNLTLSKARAQAVAAALTSKHGVAAARLHADGVGPLCPVATNDTDEGKAQNRRVELVKQ